MQKRTIVSTVQHNDVCPKNSESKRALIVTLYAPEEQRNLGNTLQHYALQEAVKSLGYESASLVCPLRELSFFARVMKGVIKRIMQLIKLLIKLVLAAAGSKKYRRAFRRKLEAKKEYTEQRGYIFAEFYDELIDGKIRATYREVLEAGEAYSADHEWIIAGSDQVWNKRIVLTDEALRFYYLFWANNEKRVCYAPSFGDFRLAKKDLPLHKKGIEGFSRLSCREKSGCDFIRELTGMEAELVLDPSLLLTPEQWRKISRKPACEIPEHYVLRYCWDPYEWEDVHNKIANGRKVIDVLYPEGEYFKLVGPREFIWLIDHADFVVTESFHGTAFSVNLGKNFLSFMKRIKNDGRIGTLLSALELTNRIYKPSMKIPADDIDYSSVSEKLDGLRESSMKYLRECLKV